MKYLLEVCLVSMILSVSGMMPVAAQSMYDPTIPVLRKGISVELPRTITAVSLPEADKEDALVLTIKCDGSAYLGTNAISIAEMPEKLRDALSTRGEHTLYLKADAHAPYASLISVLDSLHRAGIEGVTLLTAQSGASTPGTLVPPTGLPMRIVAPRAGSRSTELY